MFLSELKLFSILIIFTLLPGMALIKLFFRHLSLDIFILLSVALSLFVWTILSTLGFIFMLPLTTVVTIWIGGVVISGLWILFQIYKHKTVKILLPRVDFNFAIFLTFIILTALLVYWKGSFQDGDAWYHVAQSVNYLNQSQMVSENAFFSGYPAGTLYDFNAWHTYIAAIAMLGCFEPNFVWINLSVLVFPLTTLALFSFVKKVFNNRNFAVISVILIISTHFLNSKFSFLSSSIIPGTFCTAVLMPLFFTIYFSESIVHPERILLAILFTTAFIHIYYFLVIIGYLFVYYIARYLFKLTSKQDFLINLIGTFKYFLMGIPLLIAIYFYCLRYYTDTFPGTEIPLIYIFPNWPIFSLTADKIQFYLSVMVSLILLIKLNIWRKSPGRIFILANILIVPLMIYNPVFLYPLSKLVPLNLIGRLTSPFFLYIPIVWLLWETVLKKIQINQLAILGFIIMVISGFIGYRFLSMSVKKRIKSYNKYNEPMGFHDFAIQFKEFIPPKSVVIADSYTSYHLPVFADIDIVSMIAHSTPPIDLRTRIRDTNRFFNPLIPPEIKNTILKKYNIDYAAINSSILPWIQINNTDTLFSGNLYPDYIQEKNNIHVLQLPDSIKVGKLKFPRYTIYNDDISVFPTATIADSDELFWEHAGMIFIKTNNPVAQMIFHSQGGTHHVFYYSVIDKDHQIIEEKVFINDFSSRKIYQIMNLPTDSWVVFSGNGISPLTIRIEA